jgi:hypothetical protein
MNTEKPTETAEARQGWREDGRVDCARRGCPAAPMKGSAYCTEVHERWDNPRVAVKAVA